MWDRRSNTERGYGYKWKLKRDLVMKRDKGLCVPCLNHGRITKAKEVDHILNKARGGTDHYTNLQAICTECHKAKTVAERTGKPEKGCTLDGTPLDYNHHWNRAREPGYVGVERLRPIKEEGAG